MKQVMKTVIVIALLISISHLFKSNIEIAEHSILDTQIEDEYTIPPIIIYNDIDNNAEESEIEALSDIAVEDSSYQFTDEEEEMMCWIIQQEVRGATIKHKRIIANIILNRVKDERFPNTIKEVLESKNQFTSINNWYNRVYEPDEDTREAVHDVLRGIVEDESEGALYFYAPRWTGKNTAAWFEKNLEFLFEIEGHRMMR